MNKQTEATKPTCKLIGADGNVFNLIGLAVRALKKADKASEMSKKCFSSGSYSEVLKIIGEYVDIE